VWILGKTRDYKDRYIMKITFHGAARTVTGSQHLVEINGHSILLDCGLFQGKRKEAFELNRRVFRDGGSIDVLVLSHAHIDHSGNIPSLVKNGFKGDIYCTPATRDLCAIMLMDSAHIQEYDVRYVNRKRSKQGKKLFEPLYTQDDVVTAMDHFVGMSYSRKRQILPGVHLTLIDAGHMLGSASVILDIEDGNSRSETRVVFSGDLGRPGIPIIRDPVAVSDGADVLIIESTYGKRTHPPYSESENELMHIVNETCERGGALLVPAFSVGRTQQIVYAMHRLYNEKKIPEIPIYVDSPLATRATEVFRLHPETYDTEIRNFLLTDDQNNPFGFPTLRYTNTVEDSKALNSVSGPLVLISASGMMEGGRILHHLRNRIADPRTTILITGWQAPHTLGRRIVEGQPRVNILGEGFPLKAKVEIMTSLSAHADRDGLIEWAGALSPKPSRTFVVHGEDESAIALSKALESECGFERTDVPVLKESYTI
jgi:metallo-beta-lactamase family protein